MAIDEDDLETLLRAPAIHLTTTGRKTGTPRVVELSFALKGAEIYCLAGAGGGVHWYRNLVADPHVVVVVGELSLKGRAVRRISHPRRLARHILKLFREKYGARYVQRSYQETERAPVRIKILGKA